MRIKYNDLLGIFCGTMGLMFLLFFSSTVTPELPSTIVVHSTIHLPDLSVFYKSFMDCITNVYLLICLCVPQCHLSLGRKSHLWI